ncbi:MAG TPA: substrate-binding domain-containing protein [Acetobacteraceae bacterium]|nr:substrate-binding domain-containing protein [Acetobacteraceae bacterium]
MQEKIIGSKALMWRSVLGLAAAAGLFTASAHADDSFLQYAKKYVAQVTSPVIPWTGPTTGPKAVPGKTVVYVANDMRNGGARGVGMGAEEAAKIIGWNFRLLDGAGTVSGQNAALSQAISLKPDGIILGSVDAIQSAPLIEQAEKLGIKVVGWHAGGTAGTLQNPYVFWNVTTSPPDVGKAAALYAVAESDGHAGVVIFTDSEYKVAIAKSDAMVEWLKKCTTCTLLALKDTPLAYVSSRMGQLTTALLEQYGKKWTYSIGINDLYFDFMAPALQSAGVSGTSPPFSISAGDGSVSAFERIRSQQYQVATVAEPLRMQGWQTIDELNRAFAGAPPSGFVDPVHLFVHDNLNSDGGPQNLYDPTNGYETIYRKIWGK